MARSRAVPTTVVAALVKDKTFADPLFGMNLRDYPGVNYPIGSNFSNIAMAPDSPYAVSWWYRKQFAVPAAFKGKTAWLKFNGINYRANVWLNGKQIAKDDEVAGAWRTYEFNVTDAAKPGAENVLAVQVFSPTEHDLAITFVDWNPAHTRQEHGVVAREVYLTPSGPVALRYPTVVSKLNPPSNDSAQLTVTAQVKNGTNRPVKGKLKGAIENVKFEQDVELAANEAKDVTFTADKFSELVFSNPRLWWPTQMGKPNLYPLTMEFEVNGAVSDHSATEFGIREITSDFNSVGGRAFHINGKNILIRGGGWTPDLMLRENSQRLQDEFRYVRDMGPEYRPPGGQTRDPGILRPRRPPGHSKSWRDGVAAATSGSAFGRAGSREDFLKSHEAIFTRPDRYRLRSHPSLVMWAEWQRQCSAARRGADVSGR